MTPADPQRIPQIASGGGRIVLRSHGSSVTFAELSSTYPLKLLSPRIDQDGVAIVYVLTYGGGLVGGDCVKLAVDVGQGTILVLLSQVFATFRRLTVTGMKVLLELTGIDQGVQNPVWRSGCTSPRSDRRATFAWAAQDHTATHGRGRL
jgi:UreD urease accessory protein